MIFSANGYFVVIFNDIGSLGRTYGHNVSDGLVSATFWTTDTAGVYSDSKGDGVMEYVLATGTTSGTTTADANYAVFTGLTADGFTVSGASVSGRTALSGFQIIAVPELSSPALLGMSGLCMLRRRRS